LLWVQLIQPFVQIGLLRGAAVNAVIDAVNCFGKCAFAGGYLVGGEEAGDFFALPLGAEGAGCGDEFHA